MTVIPVDHPFKPGAAHIRFRLQPRPEPLEIRRTAAHQVTEPGQLLGFERRAGVFLAPLDKVIQRISATVPRRSEVSAHIRSATAVRPSSSLTETMGHDAVFCSRHFRTIAFQPSTSKPSRFLTKSRHVAKSSPLWLKARNPSGASAESRTERLRSFAEWPGPGARTCVPQTSPPRARERERAQVRSAAGHFGAEAGRWRYLRFGWSTRSATLRASATMALGVSARDDMETDPQQGAPSP